MLKQLMKSRRLVNEERRKRDEETFLQIVPNITTSVEREISEIYHELEQQVNESGLNEANMAVVRCCMETLSEMAVEHEIDFNISFEENQMGKVIMKLLETEVEDEVKFPTVCFLSNIFQRRDNSLSRKINTEVVSQLLDCLGDDPANSLAIVVLKCLTNMAVNSKRLRDVILNDKTGEFSPRWLAADRISEVLYRAEVNPDARESLIDLICSLCRHEVTEKQFESISNSIFEILKTYPVYTDPSENPKGEEPREARSGIFGALWRLVGRQREPEVKHVEKPCEIWYSLIDAWIAMSCYENSAKMLIGYLRDEKCEYLLDNIDFEKFEKKDENWICHLFRLFGNMFVYNESVERGKDSKSIIDRFVENLRKKLPDPENTDDKKIAVERIPTLRIKREITLVLANIVRLGVEVVNGFDLGFVEIFRDGLFACPDSDFVEAILCALVVMERYAESSNIEKYAKQLKEIGDDVKTLREHSDHEIQQLAEAFIRLCDARKEERKGYEFK